MNDFALVNLRFQSNTNNKDFQSNTNNNNGYQGISSKCTTLMLVKLDNINISNNITHRFYRIFYRMWSQGFQNKFKQSAGFAVFVFLVNYFGIKTVQTAVS